MASNCTAAQTFGQERRPQGITTCTRLAATRSITRQIRRTLASLFRGMNGGGCVFDKEEVVMLVQVSRHESLWFGHSNHPLSGLASTWRQLTDALPELAKYFRRSIESQSVLWTHSPCFVCDVETLKPCRRLSPRK